MTKTTKTKKPSHRVSFARFTGADEQGNNIVGSAREIGAIWPARKGRWHFKA